MANCKKLYQKISNNALGVCFSDLCKLAECYGFVRDRMEGSHWIYTHAKVQRPLNLQKDKDGKAKPYQVKQVLAAIEIVSEDF